MNEEIDEYDLYHQDFTTVSGWEIFIARIEEILNEWQLIKSKQKKEFFISDNGKWREKKETIPFQNLRFTLSYNYMESETIIDNEEANKTGERKDSIILSEIWDSAKYFINNKDGPFPVSNWYGLKKYIVLFPNAPLVEENIIKLVMSAINISFSNVDCSVPIFLKIREHWQQCFLGIYEDGTYKTSFDTIHLKRIPNQCSHLNNLTNLFKGKIASPVALDPVQVSAKFSYELKDLDAFKWKSINTNEFLSVDGFDVNKLIALPFGPDKNPVQSVQLNVIWPRFLENAVIDSPSYSDFDPIMAPTWNVSLCMKDDVNCLLTETVSKLMQLLDETSLLMDVLGLSKSLGLVNPLHKITEAPITISKLVKAAMGSKSASDFKGPISDELLMPLLYYIFPDAVDDTDFTYSKESIADGQNKVKPKLCSYIKASPKDGLVWRLSVAAARLYDAGGLSYLAHFWYEFSQELQYRWEHLILIPGVTEGPPNGRTCLLHQKLQMLNWCIQRAKQLNNDMQSSEEEFFDCSDDDEEEMSLNDRPPAGRKIRMENATLKNGAPLYIPRTQDPAPKTEDQLEEDLELMERLGEDARASELRARMMSASLLSDMEAFKAANPGAELCDFVQWYSPRDWKPDEGGALGERMLLPGNAWIETWNVARPVSANRQRRLFDETREAEQVLHFLRSRSVSAVAQLLLPAVIKAGASKAISEGVVTGNSASGGCDLRKTLEIGARDLYDVEREWCRTVSSRKVLEADSIDDGAEKVLDSEGRMRFLRLSGGILPAPVRKEFTMRVRDVHAPQLLRVILTTDITLIGAFTERLGLL